MTTALQSPPHRHGAKFYESDVSLYQTVAGFLCEGLMIGQPAVVVATPLHAANIEQHLTKRSINVSRAKRSGDLILLDAEDTLGTFMLGELPDGELFQMSVGGVLDQILRGRKSSQIRAYGEMVDVLWKQGRADAAITLEILWNKLALKYPFSLLCGYAMRNFFEQAAQFDEVCRQHSHLFDPATNTVAFNNRAADL